ncbi:MAG: lipid-A-disaccharide synthase [Nitrosomonadales bacterium]|nr:lipid-A-disaccharide synthase [Nitrosomonadales bacterium]
MKDQKEGLYAHVAKIAILAGEPSGDLIAAQLMAYINSKVKNVEFIGVGGPLMKQQGLKSFFNYSNLSLYGVFQVIPNIPKLIYLRYRLIKYLKIEKPDIFLGVDAPDFNFYVEKKLKQNRIPTFHYVAPSVWAWRPNRVHKIKKSTDHIFSIFPHEKPLFEKAGVKTTFVGHPLANNIPFKSNTNTYRKKLNLNSKDLVVALLPGSRMGELRSHTDILLKTAKNLLKIYPKAKFLIPTNNNKNMNFIRSRIKVSKSKNLKLYRGRVSEIIGSSNIAIAASGTASLEIALHKKPMIVIYKGSWISYLGWKIVRLIPNVSLPNILLKENIVPEMLQHKAKPSLLAKKAHEIIEDKKYLKKIELKFQKLHKDLNKNTSTLIFKMIKPYLK